MNPMLIASVMFAAASTNPSVLPMPVPTTPEQFLTMQANREKLAKQVAELSARLAAIDAALEKAAGQKKEEDKWPHYFTEDQSVKVLAVSVGEGRKMTYLRGFLDLEFTEKPDGKYEVRWRFQVGHNGVAGWREYKVRVVVGDGKVQAPFMFDANHIIRYNQGRWEPVNAHVLILKDGKPYCETLWRPDAKDAMFKPDGKLHWWDDEFKMR